MPDLAVDSLADGSSGLSWPISVGGQGKSVALDSAGDVVFTGRIFNGKSTFGPFTLNAPTSMLFVAMVSPAGKFLWAVSAAAQGNGIAVDAAGNSYIVGSFSGTIKVGTTSLTALGPSSTGDVLIAKLNASGKFLWATSGGGKDKDEGNGVFVDGAGNAYVTGYIRDDPATFGTITVKPSTPATSSWPTDT